jgi:hypothetical protein
MQVTPITRLSRYINTPEIKAASVLYGILLGGLREDSPAVTDADTRDALALLR